MAERILVGAAGSVKVGRTGKFLHLLEDGRFAGEQVWLWRRTFVQRAAMERWVEKCGRPIWLFESEREEVTVWGHFAAEAKFWNSGAGWQEGTMVAKMLVDERGLRRGW